MPTQLVCLRLETTTIKVLRELARVDKKDFEERLSEFVEDLVSRYLAREQAP